MLMMVEKELEVEHVMQYIGMQKQIISICKIIIKNMESSHLMYLDVNNLYGWAMFQKLSVNGFKWKKCI